MMTRAIHPTLLTIPALGLAMLATTPSAAPAQSTAPAPEVTYGETDIMYKHIFDDLDPKIGPWFDGQLLFMFGSSDRIFGLGVDEDILFTTSDDNGEDWNFNPGLPLQIYGRGSDTPPDMRNDGNRRDYRPYFAVSPTTDTVVAVWTYETDSSTGESDVLISRQKFSDTGIGFDSPLVNTTNIPSSGVPLRLPLNRRYFSGDSARDLFPVVAGIGNGTWLAAWQTDHPQVVEYVINANGNEEIAPGFPLPTGDDFDIFFSWSYDDGQLLVEEPPEDDPDADTEYTLTWTDPISIPGAGDRGDDTNVAITTGLIPGSPGKGEGEAESKEGFVLVWSTNDDFGGFSNRDRDIVYLVVKVDDEDKLDFGQVTPLDVNSPSDSNVDDFPQIAHGNGTYVSVWVSTAEEGLIQRNVLSSVSRGGPENWEPPVRLNVSGLRDAIANEPPRIETDGNGTWVASYISGNVFQGQPLTINYVYSTDDALSWNGPFQLDDVAPGESRLFHDLTYNPGASLIPDGEEEPVVIDPAWLIAYSTRVSVGPTRGLSNDVFTSVLNDITCESSPDSLISCWDKRPVKVDDDIGFDGSPVVRSNGQGTMVAAWSSTDDYFYELTDFKPVSRGEDSKIVLSRSTDDGGIWTTPDYPWDDGDLVAGEEFTPRLVYGGDDEWAITFYSFEDDFTSVQRRADPYFSISIDNAETWRKAVDLSQFGLEDSDNDPLDEGSNELPSIAKLDFPSGYLIAWGSTDPEIQTDFSSSDQTLLGNDADILFLIRYVNNLGEEIFNYASPLNTNAETDTGDDVRPMLTKIGPLTYLCVWLTEENMLNQAGENIGTDTDLAYAITFDDAVTWSEPRILNNNAAGNIVDGVFEEDGFDLSHDLAYDSGTGRIVAVWSTTDKLLGGGGNILLAENDIVFSYSDDRAQTWSDPVRIGGGAADLDFDESPTIRFDPRGEWLVVWTKSNSTKDAAETFYVTSRDGVNWSPEKQLPSTPIKEVKDVRGEVDPAFFPGLLNNAPSADYNTAGQWVTMWGANIRTEGNSRGDFDMFINKSEPKGRFLTNVTSIERTVLLGSDLPDEEILVGNVCPGSGANQDCPSQFVVLDATLDARFGGTISLDKNTLVGSADRARITLDYDRIDFVLLGPGVYSGNLYITAPNMFNAPYAIPITVTVVAAPTPSPSPTPVPTIVTPEPTATPRITPVVTTRTPVPSTATPTATPTPTMSSTDLTFDFFDGSGGWRFGSTDAFQAPAFRYNENLKSLDLTSTSSTNNFGFWQSAPNVLVTGNDGAPEGSMPIRGTNGDNAIYRANYQVRSSFADATAMPSLRFRASTSDFYQTAERLITSEGNAAIVPNSTGRTYSHIFQVPENQGSFVLYYDMLNFTGDATGATFSMPRVELEYLGTREFLSNEREVLSLDFSNSQSNGFTSVTGPPLGEPLVFAPTASGLSIRGATSVDGTPEVIYGSWNGTRSLGLSASRLYEARWTVGSSMSANNASRTPSFRLRLNDATFQISYSVSVNSLGNSARLPSTAGDQVYSLWFEVPTELASNQILFSFDYLYTSALGDDPTATLNLKSLVVKEFDPTFLYLAEP